MCTFRSSARSISPTSTRNWGRGDGALSARTIGHVHRILHRVLRSRVRMGRGCAERRHARTTTAHRARNRNHHLGRGADSARLSIICGAGPCARSSPWHSRQECGAANCWRCAGRIPTWRAQRLPAWPDRSSRRSARCASRHRRRSTADAISPFRPGLVAELRAHRAKQQERRLRLGTGRGARRRPRLRQMERRATGAAFGVAEIPG